MQVKEYIKVYKNFLDTDICKDTVKELSDKNCIYEEKTFYDVRNNEVKKRGDNDLDVVPNDYPLKNRQIIQDRLWFVINEYITKDFLHPSFSGWEGYSPPRFNRYKENKLMLQHCDHIHSIFDGLRKGIPIISIIGSLNNDYEGGELIFFDDYKIDLNEGDIVLFPSNFLYPHRVDKVTKGIRYSYASWVW